MNILVYTYICLKWVLTFKKVIARRILPLITAQILKFVYNPISG